MRRVTVLALVMMVAVPLCWAGSLAGVDLDDKLTVAGKELQLNGIGLREKLWVDVYVGALYLESKATDAGRILSSEQTKMVVMHFLTDRATKKKMDGAWVEGFEANSPDNFSALRARIDTFIGYFGDMKTGDEIKMVMIPGQGTTVSLNDTEKGVIEGDDFAKALLLVWLGDSPPTEPLKQGMLGQ